jgi:hypothetical protein
VKSGLDYFSLDTRLDEKFELIEAEFGLKGFAVVVKLLQRIYGQHGYYCEWTNEVALLFAKSCGFSDVEKGGNAVSEIVRAAIKRGIFDRTLYEKHGILTSAGIQKRYLDACSRRKEVTIKKAYLLLCNTQNFKNVIISSENVNISNENVYISQQSKVKESKVKESIDTYSKPSANASGELSPKDVVDMFNRLCPSLPKVIALTDARRSAIRKAVQRLGGVDEVTVFFKKIEDSDFLSGRNGKWKNCGFDWCLKAGNLVKIREGQYDNRGAADPVTEESEYEQMVESYLPRYQKKGGGE